jgi:hypothetical protein
MKKFGTPTGAAPGSAKLNDGFDEVGTPPVDRDGFGLVGVVEVFVLPPLLFDEDFFFVGEGFWWCVEVFWLVGWPPDFGVVVVGRFVVVVPVPVLDVEVDPVEVLVVCCGQVSDTMTAPAGSESVDSDTPCGTCSVSSAPPRSLTVTVQFAADAEGMAAMPKAAIAEAAATPPIASFRLLSTLAQFLPRSAGARRDSRDRAAPSCGRYWVTPLFATVNRSFWRAFSRSKVRIGPAAGEL